jgi:hypothetical protein
MLNLQPARYLWPQDLTLPWTKLVESPGTNYGGCQGKALIGCWASQARIAKLLEEGMNCGAALGTKGEVAWPGTTHDGAWGGEKQAAQQTLQFHIHSLAVTIEKSRTSRLSLS